MLPQEHLVLGIVLGLLIFLYFPSFGLLNISIIVLSSVLIDVDHYLYYVYKKNDKSVIRAYRWYMVTHRKCKTLSKEQKKKIHFGTFFLHGIEVLIILLVLGFFVSDIFYFILLGFTFHLLVDLSVEIVLHDDFSKVSIIYTFLRGRKLKFIDELDLLEPEISHELRIPFSQKHWLFYINIFGILF